MATAIWTDDLDAVIASWHNEINTNFRGDGKRVVIAKGNKYEGIEAKE